MSVGELLNLCDIDIFSDRSREMSLSVHTWSLWPGVQWVGRVGVGSRALHLSTH